MWWTWLGLAHGADLFVGPLQPSRTVEEAVRAARPGDRILVDPGVYEEGSLRVAMPLEIAASAGPGTVTLRASGVGGGLFEVVAGGALTLTGLDLASRGSPAASVSGGAELRLVRSAVLDLGSPSRGREAALLSVESTLILEDSLVSRSASALGGSVRAVDSEVVIAGSRVEEEPGAAGPAVSVLGGTLEVVDSSFRGAPGRPAVACEAAGCAAADAGWEVEAAPLSDVPRGLTGGSPGLALPAAGVDADQDGWARGVDCDDTDPQVNPGAEEALCNGVDDDCSAATGDDADEDADGISVCDGDCNDQSRIRSEYFDVYRDFDEDGYGGQGPTRVCGLPTSEASLIGGDCADRDPDRFPGNTEVPYDGVDQDCSGEDLDDLDGDGFLLADDCDDEDPGSLPGGDEVADDGVDQDCSGQDATSELVGGGGVTCGCSSASGAGAAPWAVALLLARRRRRATSRSGTR